MHAIESRLTSKIDACLTRKEFMYFMEYQYQDIIVEKICNMEKDLEDLKDSSSRHDMQIDRLREMVAYRK